MTPSPPEPSGEPLAYQADELLDRLASDHHDFAEFFRAPRESLSLTIARWPAGSLDDQQPHTEDEVYYVIRGVARLAVGDRSISVAPGTIAFVAAGVEHRFSQIASDLEVLVFWSPARHANR
jgi:mannose-6-phosphate isomerase-like protein (cupin superfamily)